MPRGGKTVRSKEQVLLDRVEIAKRYLRGEPQHIIGAALSFDRSTISRELKQIRAAWLESSLVNFNDAKARELAKLDHLEATYWDGWERSIGQIKKTTQHAEPGPGNTLRPSRATVTTEESIGDPQFLAGAERCVLARCKILGLYAPEKIAATDTQGQSIYRFPVILDDQETWAARFAPKPPTGDTNGGGSLH